jgi:hypothetical protein
MKPTHYETSSTPQSAIFQVNMLDASTLHVLQLFTNSPLLRENLWYGPWLQILIQLFPPAQGYMIFPQHHIRDDDEQLKFQIL